MSFIPEKSYSRVLWRAKSYMVPPFSGNTLHEDKLILISKDDKINEEELTKDNQKNSKILIFLFYNVITAPEILRLVDPLINARPIVGSRT